MNSVSISTDGNQARTEHEILATNLTITFQCNYGYLCSGIINLLHCYVRPHFKRSLLST